MSVDPGSIAQELGVKAGDELLKIQGEDVCDVIDYEFLCAQEELTLTFLQADGEILEAIVEKDAYEPLGLQFESGLMDKMRTCKNHCVFCFIDQMPKGGRETLHVKDDDWRMSFIMGNYISLTNVDDKEFARIISRRVSPLYISVHATDPNTRVTMMRNPHAGAILERLRALYEAKLFFHCQIVLCPGLNDGGVLLKTLDALRALIPYALSVALVPVGLTKYREGLYPLKPFTREQAADVIDTLNRYQAQCMAEHSTRFAFASDEMYILAGRELPAYEEYEDFPQIENGVGLLRLFEHEFLEALEEKAPRKTPVHAAIASGVSAAAFFAPLLRPLEKYNVFASLCPIRNDYFGHTVTVGGLITGGDILHQLSGKLGNQDALLLPRNMLRENDDVFLDGLHVPQLAQQLQIPVLPFAADGHDFIDALWRVKQRER